MILLEEEEEDEEEEVDDEDEDEDDDDEDEDEEEASALPPALLLPRGIRTHTALLTASKITSGSFEAEEALVVEAAVTGLVVFARSDTLETSSAAALATRPLAASTAASSSSTRLACTCPR